MKIIIRGLSKRYATYLARHVQEEHPTTKGKAEVVSRISCPRTYRTYKVYRKYRRHRHTHSYTYPERLARAGTKLMGGR